MCRNVRIFIVHQFIFMNVINFQDKKVFVSVAGGSPSIENRKELMFYL